MTFFRNLFLLLAFAVPICLVVWHNLHSKEGLFQKKNSLIISSILLFSISSFFIAETIWHIIDILYPIGKELQSEKLGQYGDLVGGLLNPVLAAIGIIAASLAFYAQYQANLQVKDQFKLQQFESQFYEMLKLHRANVDEMDIANTITRRKCFLRMFYEFKFVYLTLYGIFYAHKTAYNWHYTKEELCELAYKLFFFGTGTAANRIVLKVIKEEDMPVMVLLIQLLERIQREWERSKRNKQKFEYLTRAVATEDGNGLFEFEMFYYPFDGHTSRLGHYFRLLFQTVSFVVNSDIVVEREDKYNYLKMLRAQLSNHEQLLLYYNSLTSYGREWIELNYFTDYKMIKNIPTEVANFGEIPRNKLGSTNKYGENIFEWDEK
jgi:hypothetical protein